MMIRKIISIDEEKCNGCGLCIDACHEEALQLVNGKAVLISDEYCDGLGDCLPECPTGAIEIIEREAAAYDDDLVQARIKARKEAEARELALQSGSGCPGSRATILQKSTPSAPVAAKQVDIPVETVRPSELMQWPCQLNLINPQASFLQNADILIAADCTAYAYASFHEGFMKGRITLIGCPKLDNNDYYTEKIAEIIKINNPRSIKVARMEVPCCTGIVRAAKDAMLLAKTVVPYSEVTISTEGEILKEI